MILIGVILLILAAVAILKMFGKMTSFVPTVGGATRAVIGAKASLKELEVVDSIQRHGVIAAVDTWTSLTYQKGVLVGASIKVPVDAGYLSKVDIAASPDMSNTITNGLYCTSAFRLSGNAIRNAGLHRYMGPAFTGGGKTAGAAACRAKVVSYATKIALKPGNELYVEGIMCGADVGDLSMSVTFTFTKNGREHGIEDSDIREADIATKDLDTVLTTLGGDTLGNIVNPVEYNNIAAVYAVLAVGVGADYAATTRAMVICSLGGNAMKESGFYQWNIESKALAVVTTGVLITASEPEVEPLDIPTKPGNIIELHAMMIEEDPGLVNVMVGVLYSSDGMVI